MVERVECHNNIKGSSEFLGGNFKFVINYTAVLQSSYEESWQSLKL